MLAPEPAILAALLVPLAGAASIALAGRQPNLRESITLLIALALLGCVLSLLPSVSDGARPSVTLISMLPGLEIAFTVEPLGMLFALIASGLWIVNSLYSIGYMRGNNEANQTRFYVCFALALAATMGIAFAGNFFTLFGQPDLQAGPAPLRRLPGREALHAGVVPRGRALPVRQADSASLQHARVRRQTTERSSLRQPICSRKRYSSRITVGS